MSLEVEVRDLRLAIADLAAALRGRKSPAPEAVAPEAVAPEAVASEAVAPEAEPTRPTAASPSSAVSTEAPIDVDYEEIKNAVLVVIKGKGRDRAVALLATFGGAKTAKDIPVARYAEFRDAAFAILDEPDA